MFEFAKKQVTDAMSAPAISIRDDATLADAESVLEAHGFNGCPVVDASGRLVGIVTGLDLLRAFRFTPDAMVPPYPRIMASSVAEHMSAKPLTVSPDTPLTRVLQRMLDLGNTSFPVERDDQLVGVITRRDLLRLLRRSAETGAAP
jgi:CBS domain-containing protein